MAKYRGKYKKCRECKHSEEIMMWLVKVKESCPKHIKFSSMLAVDKPTCEECEYFEKEVGGDGKA
jgi:hypothetical protein